jgi:hypothetical protein
VTALKVSRSRLFSPELSHQVNQHEIAASVVLDALALATFIGTPVERSIATSDQDAEVPSGRGIAWQVTRIGIAR